MEQIIKQLQGLYFPIECWESFVLPAKKIKYKPQMLDELCASGRVKWIGRINKNTKEIALYLKEDFIKVTSYEVNEIPKSIEEQVVYDLIKSKPLGYVHEYAKDLTTRQEKVIEIINSLIWKGLVTNELISVVRNYRTTSISYKNSKVVTPEFGRWSTINWANKRVYTEQLNYYIDRLLYVYNTNL